MFNMKSVTIGVSKNKNIGIDIDVLLRTRLLIQANSGGGKSWLLRRLAEQLWGKVQIIIIDPEGEFSTLREKFGFVLVGDGGETPVSSRSAALLAHKLLELRASAVCNIYDGVKPAARHEWVRLFLDSLVDSPKKLWHPVVVIVDEAHKFCPERKAGQSEASEAMIRLATDGRKRGFAAVWATQRLAKLNKDASAELLNRLVGPTFEDLDLERAADLLSVPRSEQKDFFLQMKTLEPGNFYALGRAISKERVLLRIGNVSTTHPEAGSGKHAVDPPPPPDKVRAMLPQLKDLPQAAEARLKTEADLRAEIALLKRQLRERLTETVQASPETKIERVEVPVFKNGQLLKAEKIVAGIEKAIGRLETPLLVLREGLHKVSVGVQTEKRQAMPAAMVKLPSTFGRIRLPERKKSAPNIVRSSGAFSQDESSNGIIRGERKILDALARCHPMRLKISQIGRISRQSLKSSSFKQYIRNLKSKKFIAEDHVGFCLTDAGMAAIDFYPQAPQTPEENVSMWRESLIAGERDIFDIVMSSDGAGMSEDEISLQTGQSLKSSSFKQYLRNLVNNRLFVKQGGSYFINNETITR